MELTRSKAYHGIWWKPEEIYKRISGTLYVSELGEATFFTIETLGNLGNNLNIDVQIEALFGIATSIDENKDYSVKLYNLHKSTFSSGVLDKSHYQVLQALIGEPNPDDNSLHFSTMMLFSQTWNWWVKQKGLKFKLGNDESTSGFVASYKLPEIISLIKDDNKHIYIYFRGDYGVSVEHGFKLLEQPFLNIEVTSNYDIKQGFKIKQDVERYFMIMWGAPHLFDTIEMRSASNTQFKLLRSSTRQHNTSIYKRISFEEFIGISELTLQNWYNIKGDFENILNTFFFAYTSMEMDIHNKFLHYVFSLEQYHRKRIKDRQPLSVKNEPMYARVMELLKGDTKSWLESRLSKDRDIPISVRITELLGSLAGNDSVIISANNVNRIKSSRHYLVHLDEVHKKDCFTPDEFININGMLTQLFLKLLKQELKATNK